MRSETTEDAGQVVKLNVNVDSADLPDPRPGETATAKVRCGTASFAYVWLHEAWAFLQRKVFF